MIEFTDEFKAAAAEYRKKFGYGLPMSMIPPTAETARLIRDIRECIEKGEDDLLQRYKVQLRGGDLI